MTIKLIDLARKVRELAEKGIDGERDAAQKALERILKKSGLTIEDIEGEEKNRCYFSYRTANEENLLHQVIGSVTKESSYTVPANGNTKRVGYMMTVAERVEAELKYEIYRKLLKEEYEIFYHAFVQKNRIYHPEGTTTDISEMTPEEKAKLRRIAEMADSIKKAQIHKQLTATER